LFGGERIQNLMGTLGIEENQPIENRMLTSSIENAQRKVESKNFGIRKSVLQFDDVMNRQREIIYGQRRRVLDGENLRDYIVGMVKESVEKSFAQFIGDDPIADNWNLSGLRDFYLGWITREDDFKYTRDELQELDKEDIKETLLERATGKYEERERRLGEDIMRELERVILLRTVDEKWMDHIDAMEELRQGIYLRAYGQRDPVVEYRIEGFEMFDEMISSIQEDTVRLVLTVQVRSEEEPKREQVAKPTVASHGEGEEKRQPVRIAKKPGRNDPCPCGSGKKYKKCCGMNE
ncbi:MAG TPA: SEC-C metal-binding domain-containing protein, partial [Clostridia bacterium]|nr:SEC-C metal-binding domain-containing protein [Clostridia bacterium]